MGQTAENLHDRFPDLTREVADEYALRSQQRATAAWADGVMAETVVPMSVFTDTGWTMADRDEFLRPDTTLEGLAALSTPVPRRRARDRGQLRRADGRRDGGHPRVGASRHRARPRAAPAARVVRVRGRRAGAHGPRARPRHDEGARAGRPVARRHRPLRGQRALRRPGADLVPRARDRSRGRAPEPVRRGDRVRPPARRDGRPARGAARVRDARAPAPATASRPSASASAWARRWCGNVPDTVFHLRPVETKAGRLALVTIDNGEDWTKPPSLGRSALESGQSLLAELEGDGDWVAAVFTGKPFWFCAGADINEFPEITPETAGDGSRAGHELFLRIRALPFPTVAAINGACLGGGLELALHCSARTIASTVRHFGFPEVFLGLFPAWGGTQLTPRLIGPEPAIKLVVTNPLRQNRLLKAKDAVELGLADRLLEPVELVDESIAFALELVETPRSSAASPTGRSSRPMMRGAHGRRRRGARRLPAPYRALDLIEGAATWTVEEGYRQEEAAIGELLPGNEAQAAIYAFGLVERRAKRKPGARRRAEARAQGRHCRRRADGEPAGDALPPPPGGAGRAARPRPGDRQRCARGDPDGARRIGGTRQDDRGQGPLSRLDRDRWHDIRRLRGLRSRAGGRGRGDGREAASLRRAARGRGAGMRARDEHLVAVRNGDGRRRRHALLQPRRADAARRADPHAGHDGRRALATAYETTRAWARRPSSSRTRRRSSSTGC